VEDNNEDRELRELFRQKLENAEVIPSASAETLLMRRLGRREFLRFNPSRFNIWYIGGIVGTGILLAILLSSGPDSTEKIKPEEPSGRTIIDKSSDSADITAEKPAIPDNVEAEKRIRDRDTAVAADIRSERETTDNSKNSTLTGRNEIIPSAGVTGTVPDKDLFRETASVKDKLQGTIQPVEDLIETSATDGCAPLKVKFRNKAGSYDACRWTFGEGIYSDESDPERIFDIEGEYKVTLSVFEAGKLRSVSDVTITVHPKPKARFEISPENAVIPNDIIRFVNYSSGAVKYLWDFGDGNGSEAYEPQHAYEKFGKYNVRLVVYSEFGCSDSLVVMNAFAGSGYFINFPNAFIPNPTGPSGGNYSAKSDEAAQIFHPVHSGVAEYQLRIYSKLGLMIFESNDVNIGWDGYFKGHLSESGVYIWRVSGKFINGEPFTKMGDVTLLRN